MSDEICGRFQMGDGFGRLLALAFEPISRLFTPASFFRGRFVSGRWDTDPTHRFIVSKPAPVRLR
jgi:hypothetical protein